MAVAETARLIASLELKDAFSKQIGNAEKSLSSFNVKLDQTQSRSFRAGQQIGTGIRRTAAIAVGALGGLTSLLILSAKEGQHAADVQNVYNKAIQTSGKISADYVRQLNAQALALSNLTGQDDELIRSEQTRLIQMGLTGQQITKLLPLILDAAQSTGRDLDSVTLAVGRAVQGSATSLGKLGIIVPKVAKETKSAALISLEQARALVQVEIAQAKANGTFEKSRKTTLEHRKAVLDAQIAQQKYTDSIKDGTKATSNFDQVLSALHPFEGVNQALSQSLDVKLKVFRERLQDIREEAGIKLLPALTRIVDVTTSSLLPAFQKFIDAILPTAIKGLNEFADFLQKGGATKALSSFFDTAKAAAPILQKSAEATLTIVKAAVGLFQSLPPEIQNLAVGAFAVNKLTGGLVTNIAGGVADLIKGSRGSTPANPVFVSNVGGLPGPGGPGGPLPPGVVLPPVGAVSPAILPLVDREVERFNEFLATHPRPGSTGPVQGPPTPPGFGFNPLVGKVGNVTPQDLTALFSPLVGAIGNVTPEISRVGDTVAKTLSTVGHTIDRAFIDAVTSLERAKKPDDVAAAVKRLVNQLITQSKGSLSSTERVLRDLKTQLANTHDPKLQSVLKSAIGEVTKKLPGRAYADKELGRFNTLIADGKLTKAELVQAKGIMARLTDHGLPHAASVIAARIDAAKKDIVEQQRLNTEAVKDKDTNIKVIIPITTNVSTSGILRSINTRLAANATFSAGPGK